MNLCPLNCSKIHQLNTTFPFARLIPLIDEKVVGKLKHMWEILSTNGHPDISRLFFVVEKCARFRRWST